MMSDNYSAYTAQYDCVFLYKLVNVFELQWVIEGEMCLFITDI